MSSRPKRCWRYALWGSFSRARKVQTTVCCKHCGMPLFIERSCHEVHMFCPKCGKAFPLSEYIALADEAMEEFLSSVYCDRM
ncbi:dual CXXC motif small (seleno)protein [Bilophila wadsworthia]|uniref:dual CXXC motif small (seleno)protein n=1 Tax=Bilophila wadsworthia TaxID=35833 RepID=UPI0026DBAA77|nr:dual CXXC motif small (seleno)protein [Bilophila wadsworthia]